MQITAEMPLTAKMDRGQAVLNVESFVAEMPAELKFALGKNHG
jgi:hypothetical protein